MGKKERKDFRDQLKEIGKESFGMEIQENEPKKVESFTGLENFYMDQIPQIEKQDRRAKAPYNFVPLNKKVVTSDFKIDEVTFDKYHLKRNTGYIDLTISTLTHMYIRDNKDKNSDEAIINPDFFSPANGKLRIPGSSFRGMLRNMVEIVSFGKFGSFDDKRLYMRGLADKSSIRNEYQIIMIDTEDNFFPKVKSGWIRKEGYKKYLIYPSKQDSNGNQFYRIQFDKVTGNINSSGTPSMRLNPYEYKEIYFAQVNAGNHTHTRRQVRNGRNQNVNYELKYALVNGISDSPTTINTSKGYIINTGFMNNKHMHWIINEPDFSSGKELDFNAINDYSGDENRKSLNIIEKINSNKHGIPCFYIEDVNNIIIGFGYTAMFRLPYKKTIGEHIPNNLKDENLIDIADAIFGNEKTFSGRVFVEDSFSKHGSEILDGEARPKILSGPKPTTFQHYLTQDSEDVRYLKHYNPDSSDKLSAIRGNKLYWHKSYSDAWKETATDTENDTQHTKINPVKKDGIFSGRIRFENLSYVELGALLFALDLPEGCCHKIGMGKPLGLGSIRIESTLHLSNRENRYNDLFAEWTDTIVESDKTKVKDLKDKFADYVLKQLNGAHTADKLWEEDRMKELLEMLNFEKGKNKTETNYMNIQPVNEFKNRPVLPKPTDVK